MCIPISRTWYFLHNMMIVCSKSTILIIYWGYIYLAWIYRYNGIISKFFELKPLFFSVPCLYVCKKSNNISSKTETIIGYLTRLKVNFWCRVVLICPRDYNQIEVLSTIQSLSETIHTLPPISEKIEETCSIHVYKK